MAYDKRHRVQYLYGQHIVPILFCYIVLVIVLLTTSSHLDETKLVNQGHSKYKNRVEKNEKNMVVFLSVYQHWFNSSKQKRVYKWAYNGRGINTELFAV